MYVKLLESFKSESYDLFRLKFAISYKTKEYIKIIEYRNNPKEMRKHRERYKQSFRDSLLKIKIDVIHLHLKPLIRLNNFIDSHLKDV